MVEASTPERWQLLAGAVSELPVAAELLPVIRRHDGVVDVEDLAERLEGRLPASEVEGTLERLLTWANATDLVDWDPQAEEVQATDPDGVR